MERRDERAIPMAPIGVDHFNSLQVMKCRRQVYCAADQFEQAGGVCQKHSEMCAPDQPGVQVSHTDDLLGVLVLE